MSTGMDSTKTWKIRVVNIDVNMIPSRATYFLKSYREMVVIQMKLITLMVNM